jgi:hypothetical protein
VGLGVQRAIDPEVVVEVLRGVIRLSPEVDRFSLAAAGCGHFCFPAGA